jgi:hypothetical protein
MPERPDLGLLIDVWLWPRAVMRTVLDHGGGFLVLPLAAASGFTAFDGRGLNTAYEPWDGLAFAPVAGIASVCLFAVGLWVSAALLGHRASVRSIAAAVTWGGVPYTAAGLAGVPVGLSAAFGAPEALLTPVESVLFGIVLLAWVWSWVTSVQTLREALGVSAVRALFVWALPVIAPVVLVLSVGQLLLMLE